MLEHLALSWAKGAEKEGRQGRFSRSDGNLGIRSDPSARRRPFDGPFTSARRGNISARRRKMRAQLCLKIEARLRGILMVSASVL